PLSAVKAFMESRLPFGSADPDSARIFDLIFSTPSLRAHVRTRWTDCEDALTSVLAHEWQETETTSLRALSRFILETPDIAARADAPADALAMIFANLRTGWGLD
ncbi:MAG: TetR/AcrR family transcriptional regulator, partial [Pseudonocardia sp.]